MRVGRIIAFIVFIAFAALAAACGTGTRPGSTSPAGADSPSAPAQPDATSSLRFIEVCMVQSGEMADVTVQYSAETGDTLFGPPPGQGWPVHRGDPGYAVDQPWFIRNEPVTIGGWQYVKYGTPRVARVGELEHFASYGHSPFLKERGAREPAVLYVPLRNRCVFQAYHLSDHVHGVRG